MSQKTVIKSNLVGNITSNLIKFWQISIIFLLLLIFVGSIEVFLIGNIHGLSTEPQWKVLFINLLETIKWGLYAVGVFFLVHGMLGLVFPKTSYTVYRIILSLLIIAQIGLVFYFSQALVPLGADLFTYSFNDLLETVKAAGAFNMGNLIAGILAAVFIYYLLGLGDFIKFKLKALFFISLASYLLLAILLMVPTSKPQGFSSLESNLAENKSLFFYEEAYEYFSNSRNIYFDFYLAPEKDENALVQKEFIDPAYPFLHLNNYPDYLGPFFDEFEEKPDLVFIIVEGLGKAYSGKNAYLGSWTPFLDSLANNSLYWENMLSTTGRTFGVLPGLFGSLPYGENGFMEATPYPRHHTLMSILKENGYEINFFSGFDSKFENAGTFLQYQGTDLLIDEDDFDDDFEKAPASAAGFTWGYADKEAFQNGIRKLPDSGVPQVNIFQTASMHSPFLVPDQEYYSNKVRQHLKGLDVDAGYDLLKYENELASVLYGDDALREFFKEYLKLEKAENTIFFITGDHRLPEIPMSTKIDRFHVPFLIYSHKLKTAKSMAAVNTHLEIGPSVLAFMEENYGINIPDTVAWRGNVLDTAAVFQSKLSHALKRNKYQFGDYIDGTFYMSDNELYEIMESMYLEPITEIESLDMLKAKFEDYKGKDEYVMKNNALLPEMN
ncbi:LTA synthase family protein [Echinicola salinicaeni]|uniref:LTA synthase family protein n=1 Tax=Echinicola salinicaeni TaxID=2762757 RepID=UPI00164530D2|nr:alkaline phosphatase family protein [Echinicola salinicaeni]